MNDEKAVRVGDLVYPWEIEKDKYNECEFKKSQVSHIFKITKVPDPKPEIPDEPRTRGDVVTIEGDDEFIAVRFAGAEDLAYTFVASYSVLGVSDTLCWGEIVSRAAGRKIIVHKMVDSNEAPNMVDPNEAPNTVHTYSEWCNLSEDELSKYKWRDTDGDLWFINAKSGEFEVDGVDDGIYDLGSEYFPLTRDEKIG